MKHMSAWFSDAFDGALGEAKQALFEAHLHDCAPCRHDYSAFTATMQGLRQLGGAHMPRKVVLPATPPVAAKAPWWASLLRTRLMAPVGVAAVGAAAALTLLVIHPVLPSPAVGSTALNSQDKSLSVAGGGTGLQNQNGISAAQAPSVYYNNCAVTSVSGQSATGPPSDFSHVTSQTDSSRPGEILYVATQQSSYARGASITVFAVLVDTNRGKVIDYSPCVYLETPDQTGLARAVPSPNPNTPSLYLVVSSPQVVVTGGQVNLVARIAQDYPSLGQAELTATLTVTLN